jgi:hypothetical protein
MTTARIDQIPTRRNYLPAGAIIRAMEQPDSGSRVDITINADAITQRLNALAPRQGVAIPAANSISTVSVLALGTSDFSVTLPPLMLSDYTISDTDAANLLFESHTAGNNRVRVGLRATGGVWRITFTDGAAADTTYDITPTRALVDGLRYAIALTFDRDGLATLYVDGQANGTVDISAAAAIDIGSGNTNLARWLGGTATAGTLFNAVVHNFAIPATTTSGVVGVAERYASGVWVQAGERHTAFANIIDATTLNGGFETAGAGGADVFANWNESASGSSTVNQDTSEFYEGAASCRLDIVAGVNVNVSLTLGVVGQLYRIRFWAKGTAGATMRFETVSSGTEGVNQWRSGTSIPALTGSWQEYVIDFVQSSERQIRFIRNGTTGDYSIWIDAVTLTPLGSTLDLTPIGVGRVLIDRSASRNHAIVSGTVHPTYLQPAESGRIIATTNETPNQQLLALSAFDAANKYRITSWTVTSTGTPTISLGNVSAGTQYVNGLTLVANTPTAVTLATSIAATANLWCNSSTTDPVTHVITYERIS